MSFAIVDIDALQLKIGLALVASIRLNSMLVGNHFPELNKFLGFSILHCLLNLSADLIAALACLNVNNFTHFAESEVFL